MDSGGGGLESEGVHDLDRARQQPTGHDCGDGVARLFERTVTRQHGVEAFGSWEQLQGDLQRDAEEALVAIEQAAPVRADILAAKPAPLDHLPGAQHSLQAQDVVGGHAVFEAVGAAGVKGDVAADSANEGAGRVGRVMEAVRGRSQRYVRVHDARFDHGDRAGPDRAAECASGG